MRGGGFGTFHPPDVYRVKEDLHIACFLLTRTTKTLIMKPTAWKCACAAGELEPHAAGSRPRGFCSSSTTVPVKIY